MKIIKNIVLMRESIRKYSEKEGFLMFLIKIESKKVMVFGWI